MKQPAQAFATEPEQHERPFDATQRPRQLKGWWTIAETAERLRFTVTAPRNPEKACRDWLKREGIATVRRGRVILVDSLDVDAAMRKVR